MNITGKYVNLTQDFVTGDTFITFKVNESNLARIESDKIKNCDKLSIKVVKYREKRSLDANAMLWTLLSKMSDVLKTNKDDLYIEMLSRYGVFTHIIVKPSALERVKAEWRDAKDLGEVFVNGVVGIQLQCYFGSSTYNTKEMSVLIDGVVNECKELDIETLSPNEIDQMKKEWGI